LECYDLGRVAYTNGDFYHTLMWMQEALDHLDKEINNTSVNKFNILDHLAYATLEVNDRVGFCQENFFLFLARKY
jgi:prolyl 4-hydroxylase